MTVLRIETEICRRQRRFCIVLQEQRAMRCRWYKRGQDGTTVGLGNSEVWVNIPTNAFHNLAAAGKNDLHVFVVASLPASIQKLTPEVSGTRLFGFSVKLSFCFVHADVWLDQLQNVADIRFVVASVDRRRRDVRSC